MHEIKKKYKNGIAIAYCKNTSITISFNTCFEYEGNIKLPTFFYMREDRIFLKPKSQKLQNFDNILYKIKIEGNVNSKDLQTFLPTIFDVKIIKKYNSTWLTLTNFSYLTEISDEVLGTEETKEILNNKII